MIRDKGPYEPGDLVRLNSPEVFNFVLALKKYPPLLYGSGVDESVIPNGSVCMFLGYDEELLEDTELLAPRGRFCKVLYEGRALWIATSDLW